MKIVKVDEVVKAKMVVLKSNDVFDIDSMLCDFLPRLDEVLRGANVELQITQLAGLNPDYEITVFRKPMKRAKRTRRSLLG